MLESNGSKLIFSSLSEEEGGESFLGFVSLCRVKGWQVWKSRRRRGSKTADWTVVMVSE